MHLFVSTNIRIHTHTYIQSVREKRGNFCQYSKFPSLFPFNWKLLVFSSSGNATDARQFTRVQRNRETEGQQRNKGAVSSISLNTSSKNLRHFPPITGGRTGGKGTSLWRSIFIPSFLVDNEPVERACMKTKQSLAKEFTRRDSKSYLIVI